MMTHTEKAVAAMQQLGGAFVEALAGAWLAADPWNRARLEQAFAPEFQKYAELSRQAEPEMQP
ncbi:MAG: hypothetical protein J0I30_06360 [Burkholderiales bacterium]|nr:hypothetical protein [Burkholderiales bacterium]